MLFSGMRLYISYIDLSLVTGIERHFHVAKEDTIDYPTEERHGTPELAVQ